ncbi:MAG TPA: hypothetical protein VFR90_03235 [Methylibium sp.]|uniref:hypothetical protein n=1 Tax=Methylibium sp. TaxID=2067992 RepID=UPI002DBFFE35|nr:hypothetical protein [Methylibium sp.]HEU4458114.1 hypothetical protein [Methylibium sp.]
MNDYPSPAELDAAHPVPQTPAASALAFRDLLTTQMLRVDEYLALRQTQVQAANAARSVSARCSLLTAIAATDQHLTVLADAVAKRTRP